MADKDLEELRVLGVDISKITPEEIFKVHMLNIGVGILMLLIGSFLLFNTRKEKKSGKKTAEWILIGIGITVCLVHVVQMLVQ
jgi:hypothetical protein